MERVLAWAEDQETQITSTEITDRFGTGAADAVEGVQDKSAQLYAVMQNLMEGEAFSIARSTTRGNGLEAWRKINRRLDTATGGSRCQAQGRRGKRPRRHGRRRIHQGGTKARMAAVRVA